MSGQFVTFYLGPDLYGIDVLTVQEVLPLPEVTPVPLAPKSVAGLVNLRGQVVLALDLRVCLGLSVAHDPQVLVVVRHGVELVALLVDRIGEVVEVVGDELAPLPATLTSSLRDVLRGAYKLPNQLLLALDVGAAAGLTTRSNSQ